MPTARLRVAIFVEVEGAGDYFPPYAGNLDIMTAAAAATGEAVAQHMTATSITDGRTERTDAVLG